jgi:hydroxymethylpyrimidine pyrophosphatase-like HAD family hydrolase
VTPADEPALIKLFLTDIDGCLSEPYEAFDANGFAQLRAWADEAEADPLLPRVGICSGRAYAYVEAVAQMLDLRGPALFESGGGRFDLPTARIRWSAALTSEVERQLDAVRAFFLDEIIPRGSFSFDYGKRAQAGVVTLDPDKLAAAVRDTQKHVRESYPDLMVADTHVSVDVLPRGLSKRVGIEEAAREEGLDLSEIAFIGDTHGDMCALEVVGASFAPANAQPAVRACVHTVTRGSVLDGVLEAYQACVAHNRRAVAAVDR